MTENLSAKAKMLFKKNPDYKLLKL